MKDLAKTLYQIARNDDRDENGELKYSPEEREEQIAEILERYKPENKCGCIKKELRSNQSFVSGEINGKNCQHKIIC